MCSIAGIFQFSGQLEPIVDKIKVMTHSIRHRGPDDEGYSLINTETNKYTNAIGEDSVTSLQKKLSDISTYKNGRFNLAFGHRRFSIIDLSVGGHQPYWDENRQICGIFNGLIYNYIEVMEQLKAKGYIFRTTSDTETLFKAYLNWGVDCFKRLNGTWAVAIYDFKTNELILSRDRIGKKPLYLYKTDGKVFFASEIKAILSVIENKPEVNEEIVIDYIVSGYRDHTTKTFYRGIQKIPPGIFVKVDHNGNMNTHNYWELPHSRDTEYKNTKIEKIVPKLESLLRDAVKIRLRADVGIGLELSGGLDSSTVAALSCSMLDNQISSFTVKFPQPEFDEEPYARIVAKHCNLNYHIVNSPDRWFWSDVDDFVYLQEEPFHSPNLHTQQSVWRLIRNNGNKVILYGAGGDEVFAGYRKEYFYRYLRDLLKSGKFFNFFNNFINFSELSSIELIQKYVRKILLKNGTNDNVYLTNILGKNGNDVRFLMPISNSLESQLYINMTSLKMPYWLISNDKSSMAIPTEVRAPLLDYRIIEFAFQLPVNLLIHKGWLKWILRRTMADSLPKSIIWRSQKMGYPFPLQQWLQDSHNIISYLFKTQNNPFLNKEYLQKHIDQIISFQPGLLWRILSLELWHRRIIRNEKILNTTLQQQIDKMNNS